MANKRSKKQSIPKAGLFLWNGRHFQIKAAEKPKEEFAVDDYTVYAFSSSTTDIDLVRSYAFVVVKDGKQTATISVDGHPIMGPMYYLEGVEYGPDPAGKGIKMIRHVTYRMYFRKPSYRQVKTDLTAILRGKSKKEFFDPIKRRKQ